MELPQADVLLCVATPVEFEAVRDRTDAFEIVAGAKRLYYSLGSIGGAEIALVQCEMGSATPGGAITTLNAAIGDLRPWCVIQVGIAFGMDEPSQPIGRVLVSTGIAPYELGRVSTSREGQATTQRRGNVALVSPRLLSRMRGAAALSEEGSTQFGLMLSGEKLIDNLEFRDTLKDDWPEAIGGDMEGFGMSVAAIEHNVACCIVKGVCDYADGKKCHDKKPRQHAAAAAAATFVVRALERCAFGRQGEVPPPSMPVTTDDSTTRNIRSRLEEVLVSTSTGTGPSIVGAMSDDHQRAVLNEFLSLPDDGRQAVLVDLGVLTWEQAHLVSTTDEWISALRTVVERGLSDAPQTATRVRLGREEG